MYTERTCAVCGKPFTPKARSEAQYCSKRCASLKTYSPDQLEAPVLTAQEVARIKARILVEKFKRRNDASNHHDGGS